MLRHATRSGNVLKLRPSRTLPSNGICWQCCYLSTSGSQTTAKGPQEAPAETDKGSAQKEKNKEAARERFFKKSKEAEKVKARRKKERNETGISKLVESIEGPTKKGRPLKRKKPAAKPAKEEPATQTPVVRRVKARNQAWKADFAPTGIKTATQKNNGRLSELFEGQPGLSLLDAMNRRKDEMEAHRVARATQKPPSSILKQVGTEEIERRKGVQVEGVICPVNIEGQQPVRQLAHGLDRVLFNPGVFYLQDPRTRIYNFDPYIQSIMPVADFDFDAITAYITSSKDKSLEKIARDHGKRYIGSTSSMTSSLSHLHFLLSAWRPLNFGALSKSFNAVHTKFTEITRGPSSIFLRYKGDGVYAIDADKEFDTESVFSLLGHSLEKLLTSTPEEFELYRKGNSHKIAEEERSRPETYHYSTYGDFLMRSQLDAQDDRLPGSGTFDLKTRAVVSVRMDAQHIEMGSGYQIKTLKGDWESFEREYFDLIRSAFLKYSLQARMGRMDGIFLTYHNTEKIFGFQYMPLEEMDIALHGVAGSSEKTSIGAQEFRMSLMLMNKLLNKATTQFPQQSLRIHFETRPTNTPMMYFFAEPMSEEEIEQIQEGEKGEIKGFIDEITGQLRKPGPVLRSSVGASAADSEQAQELGKEQASSIEEASGNMNTTASSAVAEETPINETEHLVDDTDPAQIAGAKSEVEAATEEALETGALAVSESGLASVDSGATESDTPSASKHEGAMDERSPPSKEEIVREAADSFPHIIGTNSESGKPLLALALSIRNYINGHPVTRVTSLEADEKWTIEYSLAELKNSWKTYNMVKTRKRTLFDRAGVPDDEAKIGAHLAMLRKMSAAGREYEREWALKEKGKPKVVFKSKSEKLEHYLHSFRDSREAQEKAEEEISPTKEPEQKE